MSPFVLKKNEDSADMTLFSDYKFSPVEENNLANFQTTTWQKGYFRNYATFVLITLLQ